MKLNKLAILVTALIVGAWNDLAPAASVTEVSAHEKERGVLQVPAFALPQSSLLSTETRAVLKNYAELSNAEEASYKACPAMERAKPIDLGAIRGCQAQAFYKTPFYQRLRGSYAVTVTPRHFGGVYTEVFTPTAGITPKNQKRVLINMHSGAFDHGARITSHLESIPIAALGRIKVISIDYRLAPEYWFPAASEDVAAVYRDLLKTYKPKNIGMYGCSAGGLLTAEAIAWFQKERLPLPGATGMFCAGADFVEDGDSGYIGSALEGDRPWAVRKEEDLYFKGTSPSDPLTCPARSLQVMAKFPPSLLISSTRDYALSSVVHTHSLLIGQGVEADLHVWEGLGHGFFVVQSDLPESREAYQVIVSFFEKHLGR